MIADGHSITGLTLGAWARSAVIQRLAHRRGLRIPPLTAVDEQAEPAVAVVNWGSWKAECPACAGGAEDVWLESPLFFCLTCGNQAVGGLWRRVVLPDNIAAIEAGLAVLPREQRNWRPGEEVGSDG